MYELSKSFSCRVANNSIIDCFNPENENLLNMIYVSSPTLYETITGREFNTLPAKAKNSFLKYHIRSKSRTTPFGTMASFFSADFKGETNYFIIGKPNVKASMESEWMSIFISEIESANFEDLIISWNYNSIDEIGNLLINSWPTSINNNNSQIYVNNTKALAEVKSILKEPKRISEVIRLFSEKYTNIDKKVLTSFIGELLKKEIIISNLKSIKCLVDIDALFLEIENSKYRVSFSLLDTVEKRSNFIQSLKLINSVEQMKQINDTYKLKDSEYAALKIDSITNLQTFELSQSSVSNELSEFVTWLSTLNLKNDKSTYYKKLVNAFQNLHGYSKIPFTEFYKELSNSDIDVDNGEIDTDFKKYLVNKFNVMVSKGGEISLDDLELDSNELPDIQHEYSSLSLGAFVMQDQKKLIYQISPLGIAKEAGVFEGRFGFMDSEYAKNLTINLKNSLNDLGVIPVFIHAYPKKSHYLNIMNDVSDEESYTLNYGLFEHGNHQIQLKDIWISYSNKNKSLILSTDIEGKESVIKICKQNVANPLIFYPEILRIMLTISENYFFEGYGLLEIIDELRFANVYYPKITYKNVIIRSETWNLSLFLENKKYNKSDFSDELKTFRDVYNVPREVYVVQQDRRLLLDLHTDFEIVFDIYSKRDGLILIEENYFSNTNLIIHDGVNQPFLGEFIFNFYQRNANREFDIQTNKREVMLSDTKKIGFKWLNVEIILPKFLEEVYISRELNTLLDVLKNKKIISKFFFIRYREKNTHIRLRVDYSPVAFDELRKGLISHQNCRIIDDFNFTNYYPEIARYGGIACINTAEEFFCNESEIVIMILSIVEGQESKQKILWAVNLAIDIFISFYDSLEEIVICLNAKNQNIHYTDEYREMGKSLNYQFKRWNVGGGILTEADPRMKCLIKERKKLATIYRKSIDDFSIEEKEKIVFSLIHIMCIRLFGVSSEEEPLVNNLVWRTLRQIYARIKYNDMSESDFPIQVFTSK